ncbi:flippase [Rheinheimera pacifica]|uniref:flippase n=1 Tax=Rheinheimera pacifica TaxID=173990 RepID=UPI002ED7F6AD
MISKIRNIASNKSIVRYGRNSAWMMAEYSLNLISGVFVGIYVARYLGPEQFGALSYALAIVTIFMAISRLGMESILVRDISKNPLQRQAYMSTAFGIMWIAAVIVFTLLSAIIYFLEVDFNARLYVWIIATSILFQTFLVIDYNFQAQVQAKFSSISKSLSILLSVSVKIYLVYMQADLLFFAIAYAIDNFFVALALLVMHLHKRQINFLKGFDLKLVKPLLSSAWPMILAGLSAMLYMRIDQIMIKNMLDTHQLGLYSAATKIYEGWIIISVVFSLSLLPAIVSLKAESNSRYESGLSKLLALLFWICFAFAVITTIYNQELIIITYGPQFISSSSVLIVLIWAAMFNAIGSVSARYLTVESMEKKIAIRTFLGLFLNLALNLFLIPKYGIEGAAYATLITVFFINYIINFFDKELRQLRRICNNAIFLRLGVS